MSEHMYHPIYENVFAQAIEDIIKSLHQNFKEWEVNGDSLETLKHVSGKIFVYKCSHDIEDIRIKVSYKNKDEMSMNKSSITKVQYGRLKIAYEVALHDALNRQAAVFQAKFSLGVGKALNSSYLIDMS